MDPTVRSVAATSDRRRDMMLCDCGKHPVGRNMVDGKPVCGVCFQRHCIDLQMKQYEDEGNDND